MLLGGCGDGNGFSDEHYKIVIGHSDTRINPIHIELENFAKAVELRSKGRVEVQIAPAEQIGTNAEMFEMLERGTLDVMMIPAGQEAVVCPKFKTLGLPFLFSDYEHVYKVLDGDIGKELVEGLADHNMIQIAYWENGLRQITNDVRPINSPEDLVELRFRTPNDDMTVAIFNAYGAVAEPYAFSQLYMALQQHLFDGQENPVANIYANKFQDVQRYLTMVNYQYQPKSMVFALTTWDKLPKDIQAIISDAAKEFGTQHRNSIVHSEQQMLAELTSLGMIINHPDTQPFIDAAQSVYEDFYADNYWGKTLVERINALK